jgi:hypothetical protein
MRLTRLQHHVWGLLLLVCVGLPSAAHALPIGTLVAIAQAAYQAYQTFNGSNEAVVH